jgi:predicted nucleotidyltransferase
LRLHIELLTVIRTEDQRRLDQIHDGLRKLFRVSQYLDFPFKLTEVVTYFLPGLQVGEEELVSLIRVGKFIDLPFQIRDGCLLTSLTQSGAARLEREQLSVAKLNSAMELARTLTRLVPFIRTIAVTGSVAYGSARKWDDVDLFIITGQNRLWLSTLLSLALIRLRKLFRLRPFYLLQFCLSYVHDERGFENESQRNKSNVLFARELLKAYPIAGIDEYRDILEQNAWIHAVYPQPYLARLKQLRQRAVAEKARTSGHLPALSFLIDWAERVTFVFLSRYLSLRAYLTNLELRSRAEQLRVFEPKLTAMSCIYVSNFYRWLQALWSGELGQ